MRSASAPAILRLQNVYGEGQSLQNPYTGIISIFFNRARQGLTLPLYEDGLETRDFVHVDDVVAALAAALTTASADELHLQCRLRHRDDRHRARREPVAAAGPTSHAGHRPVPGRRYPAQLRRYRSGARDCWVSSPGSAWIEGLRRFCAWAASEPVYADRLDQATAELKAKGLTN